MDLKATIKSQYWASLEMLRQVILNCPDSLWAASDYKNQFWNIAYHVLFYTHLYLHPKEDDYVPWKGLRGEHRTLGSAPDADAKTDAYRKEELLAYLHFCAEQVDAMVEALELDAESGFYWLPFDKLELQFYNIRHIMQHMGELGERLGAKGEVDVRWVGMKPADG